MWKEGVSTVRSVAFLTLALLVPRVSVSAAQDRSQAEEKKAQELKERVAELATRVSLREADVRESPDNRLLLREAGESGERALIPHLRVIAETESPDIWLHFGALDALWRLGEDESYFVDMVRSEKTTAKQKSNAIWILAREPSDKALEVVKAIDRDRAEDWLPEAIQRYYFSAHQRSKYEKATTLEEKVRFLVPWAGMQYTPWGIDRIDPERSLHPLTVWSGKVLFDLSVESPKEVAEIVWAIRQEAAAEWEGEIPGREIPGSFGDYLEGLLGEESRKILHEKFEAQRRQ